ncbi:hypothetical protein F4775DRAFT_155926 [Biscogniauxia sp. FL1348]|nr:hypothetical protein F4775DRAFT_155926 [Biscogniauxia sp. FL1348]
MMMALTTNTSQLGRSARESREMAESPILHELPRIRSVAPANPPPAPHLSSSTTPVAPPVDSYFALQIHSKSAEAKRISTLYPEKSAVDTGVAITTPVPSSPASSSIPPASPYTPVSPSLFPIPPSRSSTPNVSIPTSRSASTLLSTVTTTTTTTTTTTRGYSSSLGDATMGTSTTSIASPPTTFSSPASTPIPFSPRRMSIFPRCQRMPSTPSPVYSPPRYKYASRSPRPYAEKHIEAGGDHDKGGGLYIDTKSGAEEEEEVGEKPAPQLPRHRESRRQSAAALSMHRPSWQAETPRSPAYAGSWLEVRGRAGSPRASVGTDTTETDSDSISPILARPAALLRAFGGTNTSRHTTYVVHGEYDYDTHSMSAMWFGETRKRAYDYLGPEPDFAVAVVQERQRRRRNARRVKMAGGVAVIAVLFIVAIVVGVSLSIR